MEHIGQKLLFFGNERLATGVTTDTPVLKALLEVGYEIPAIIVAQNDTGSSRVGRMLEVLNVAEEHGIKVLSPARPMDILEELQAFGAEAAVLVAYGKLLPKEVIDIFPRGIVNLHPSLLPRHRGPTPIEHTILMGEAETAVSLMELSEIMDAGPIYAQETLVLEGKEDKQDLCDRLGLMGAHQIVHHLPAILDGSLEPTPQDDQLATYDTRLSKQDSQLDFTKTSRELERQIRAYFGWPRSRTTLGDIDVIITRAHTGSDTGVPGSLCLGSHQLGVYTADGALLIDTLIPAGKREMTAEAFLAGYQLG
jgi:methionyl-tRNA formyltransferase